MIKHSIRKSTAKTNEEWWEENKNKLIWKRKKNKKQKTGKCMPDISTEAECLVSTEAECLG